MSTKGTLILNQQECEGNYDFEAVQHYMTRGFQLIFSELSLVIVADSLAAIREHYPDNADYFQVFEYVFPNHIRQKFYCIHDETHVIFLLPDEY